MNIVEKEAKSFYRNNFGRGSYHDLESSKSNLTSKLYDFNRDRDKLDFLKNLRVIVTDDIEKHMKSCSGCGFEDEKKILIFAIDQEIDSIMEYYTFTPKSEQSFTVEEETNLHSKLNDIIEELKKQGTGQEIIFDEIEDLKNHFNLGKKTWFQLVKGKMMDLTIEKALEQTIVAGIFTTLTDGFNGITKLIP